MFFLKRFLISRADLFVIADAVLIALACIMVVLAYREINTAPIRHAEQMSSAILMVSDDFSGSNPLEAAGISIDGQRNLSERLNAARKLVSNIRPGAKLDIFSEHPHFSGLSLPGEPFLSQALELAIADPSRINGRAVEGGASDLFRAAVPFLAPRDCTDCKAIGAPDYRKGDVVGLRVVTLPLSTEFGYILDKLIYAFAVLAVALMCVIGIILPMIRRNKVQQDEISTKASKLQREATTDPLTGLHNRRYFEQALQNYIVEFGGLGCPLGLLVLDIDHFKVVNDTHGHDVGDYVLAEVALRLKAITREHDVVARIGGEEFAVITPFATREQLLVVAERYRNAIADLRIVAGKVKLNITISIGVATNEDGNDDGSMMYKKADLKLYEAKRKGRNCVAA